jgi:serine/threonine protein kinase
MAKVSDFGLSRALQAGQSHRSTRTFGTLNHTAPELLRLGRLSPAGGQHVCRLGLAIVVGSPCLVYADGSCALCQSHLRRHVIVQIMLDAPDKYGSTAGQTARALHLLLIIQSTC